MMRGVRVIPRTASTGMTSSRCAVPLLLLLAVQSTLLPLLMVGGPTASAGPSPQADRPSAPSVGPSLTVTLGPETLIAHVTGSENGPAIFNGTVTVDRFVRGLRVTV